MELLQYGDTLQGAMGHTMVTSSPARDLMRPVRSVVGQQNPVGFVQYVPYELRPHIVRPGQSHMCFCEGRRRDCHCPLLKDPKSPTASLARARPWAPHDCPAMCARCHASGHSF